MIIKLHLCLHLRIKVNFTTPGLADLRQNTSRIQSSTHSAIPYKLVSSISSLELYNVTELDGKTCESVLW